MTLGPCILSTCHKDKDGYGKKWHKGRTRGHHRVAYCEYHGVSIESIDGILIRHRCDNPPCINPEHLEPGTTLDNVADRVARGRTNAEPAHKANEKVSDAVIAFIRANYVFRDPELGGKPLAKRFGLSRGHVSEILSRKYRK